MRPWRNSWRVSRAALLPFAAGILFFFGPAFAWVGGMRADPIDNRPLAPRPELKPGDGFATAFTAFANDRLPMRKEAIELGTDISQELFGEPPRYGEQGPQLAATVGATGEAAEGRSGVGYPQVVAGERGWLFYGLDFENPCEPELGVREIAGRLARLSRAIERAGKRFVVVVAPDKSTVVPERLPDSYAGEGCARERRAAVWRAVKARDEVPLLDLRRPLAAAQRRLDRELYRPRDTHWNPEGAAVFMRALARRLDPRLLRRTRFERAGTIEQKGDLASLLGVDATDAVRNVVLEREGVTTLLDGAPLDPRETPALPFVPVTIETRSSGAALVRGPTAIIGDSFLDAARMFVPPFFARATLFHVGVFKTSPEAAAAVVADSDTVVFELAERDFVSGSSFLLDPLAGIAAVERALDEASRR